MGPENEDALFQQSLAMLQIAKDIVCNSRRRDTWLVILVIVSLLVNVAIAALFVHYESQFVTTETITTTVEQDTGDGGGNNVYQAGEQASYIQGNYKEEILDGQATSDYYSNENSDSQVQP